MEKFLVYGSGEFGRVIRDLLDVCGLQFAGYVDDFNKGGDIKGCFSDAVRRFPSDTYGIVIAIGYKDLNARWSAYRKVLDSGYAVPAIIHPKAYVRDESLVGKGAIVMAGAIVDSNASIGELCVLWPGAVVNHDSIVGKNTFLSPNATVCGAVEIEGGSFIGAGAVIVDHVTVPYGTFVRAGAVYTGREQKNKV